MFGRCRAGACRGGSTVRDGCGAPGAGGLCDVHASLGALRLDPTQVPRIFKEMACRAGLRSLRSPRPPPHARPEPTEERPFSTDALHRSGTFSVAINSAGRYSAVGRRLRPDIAVMTKESESLHQQVAGTQMVTRGALSHVSEETAKKWLSAQDFEAPVSSNRAAGNLPFQRWFHFKEAYSPAFVTDTIADCDYPVRDLLDPFGGQRNHGTHRTNAGSQQYLNRGKPIHGRSHQGEGDANLSRIIHFVVSTSHRPNKSQ